MAWHVGLGASSSSWPPATCCWACVRSGSCCR